MLKLAGGVSLALAAGDLFSPMMRRQAHGATAAPDLVQLTTGKIDYRKAKQGYEFLRETPQQMRQIIDEDREALETVLDELERQRDDVAKQLGLPESIDLAQQITDEREKVLAALDGFLQTIEKTQHEIHGDGLCISCASTFDLEAIRRRPFSDRRLQLRPA